MISPEDVLVGFRQGMPFTSCTGPREDSRACTPCTSSRCSTCGRTRRSVDLSPASHTLRCGPDSRVKSPSRKLDEGARARRAHHHEHHLQVAGQPLRKIPNRGSKLSTVTSLPDKQSCPEVYRELFCAPRPGAAEVASLATVGGTPRTPGEAGRDVSLDHEGRKRRGISAYPSRSRWGCEPRSERPASDSRPPDVRGAHESPFGTPNHHYTPYTRHCAGHCKGI